MLSVAELVLLGQRRGQRSALPTCADLDQQARIRQQLVKHGEILRQLADLYRQQVVEQRLDLPACQPQHPPSQRPTRRADHLLTRHRKPLISTGVWSSCVVRRLLVGGFVPGAQVR